MALPLAASDRQPVFSPPRWRRRPCIHWQRPRQASARGILHHGSVDQPHFTASPRTFPSSCPEPASPFDLSASGWEGTGILLFFFLQFQVGALHRLAIGSTGQESAMPIRVKSRPQGQAEAPSSPMGRHTRFGAELPDISDKDSFREVVKKLSMCVSLVPIGEHRVLISIDTSPMSFCCPAPLSSCGQRAPGTASVFWLSIWPVPAPILPL